MDSKLAATYIGKRLLVGITYHDHEDKFLKQDQFYGEIVRIDRDEGIVLRLSGSQDEYILPPDLDALRPAPAGEYQLRSTGEVVRNPDFTTTYTVKQPLSEE